MNCPLCSEALSVASLEAHLRAHVDLPQLRCRLCRLDFVCLARARAHFLGPFAAHPGQEPRLLDLPPDEAKERRLVELVRLASGGEVAVRERLCVCGQCRLLCREEPAQGLRQACEPAQTSLSLVQQQPLHLSSRKTEPQPKMMELPRQVAESPSYEAEPASQAEEAQAPLVDVKPSLAELKAELVTDGRVACLLCGQRLGKEQLKSHAASHSEARPFSCLLCVWAERSRGELAKHLRREHGAAMAEAETFAYLGSDDEQRRLLESCFGAAKDALDYERMRCKPCDKVVKKSNVNNHIATNHLKKPLHTCRLCNFASVRYTSDKVKEHVRKVHKREAGPETVDGAAFEHFGPIVRGMIPQLFAKQ